MGEFLHRLILDNRSLLGGLGMLVLAALDLADPALLTGLGVLIAALASEIEA